MYRSLIFDPKLYKAVRDDRNLTIVCLIIVLIASFANGFATYYFTNVEGLINQVLFSIVGWVVRSIIIFLIAVKIIGYDATIDQLIRTLGVSYSPMILNLLAIIPLVGINIYFITVIWLFLLTIYAVKITCRCSRIVSLLITLVALIPYGLIMFFLIR